MFFKFSKVNGVSPLLILSNNFARYNIANEIIITETVRHIIIISVYNIISNLEIVIVNSNNEILSDDAIIGTGNKIQVKEDGKILKEYQIIVYGDVNGDGKINSVDLLVLQRHILEIETLDDIYQKSENIRKNK